jgi:hypothetical protein
MTRFEISKIVNLIKSFFDSKEMNKQVRVVKWNSFDSAKHNVVWQVVEYSKYNKLREKVLNGRRYEVGLQYTLDFLAHKECVYKILLMNAFDFSNCLIDYAYLEFFDCILILSNDGQDLGSHIYTLQNFLANNNIGDNIPIVLSNSSFKPKSDELLNKLFDITKKTDVLIGNGYSYGPRYFIFKKIHLQSYFLLSRFKTLTTISNDIKISGSNKLKIIRDGEIKFSQIALQKGVPLLSVSDNIFNIFSDNSFKYKFYDSRISSYNISSL